MASKYLLEWMLALGLVGLLAGESRAETAVRLKDMAHLQMGEETQLTGMGLIIGLEGTGDGRQASFTTRMLTNMMGRMNLAVDPGQIRIRNVAAVSVTATLTPYVRKGSRFDIQAASIGDASSLQGGTLLLTNLMGADGKVYATGQGAVSIGGFNLGGAGAGSVRKNHSVVGSVPNGGLVIEEPARLERLGQEVILTLNDPDWTTSSRTAWAIDEFFGESGVAVAVDAGTIAVTIPGQFNSPLEMAGFLADLEKVVVIPDLPARVVVNEKTGTVIVGDHVSVAAVALSHGALKLKIPGDSGQAADPLGGQQVTVEEEPDHLHPILNSFDVGAMPTVKDLVRNLNALGVTPRELIAILQALKTAGALRAELIIQ